MPASNRELLDVAERAARAGAEQLLSWQGRFATRHKSLRDLVTDADLASEHAVRGVIAAAYPHHGVLGEESAGKSAADPWKASHCWLVDPLDGTTNYVHGFPCYAVSVAVAERGQLLAGVVLDPQRGECFRAAAGEGAWLNDAPIRTSPVEEIPEALVAVSFPPQITEDSPDMRSFLRVAPVCQGLRRTGSAALNLAYVACGRLDGHWAHEIHPWDGAAGVLLVQEAGGVATDGGGKPHDATRGDYLAASTTELHRALLALVGR